MAKINISEQIKHLETLCEESCSNIVIFTFKYNSVNFKCVYMYKNNTILLAAEDYNIGFNIRISVKGQLDNYLSNENYNILKQIYENYDFKTKALCNNMLGEIKQLTVKDVKRIPSSYLRGNKDITENEKIYFKCWARNKVKNVSEENLQKTRAYFGEEIYEICKRCNISSRWKSKMHLIEV